MLQINGVLQVMPVSVSTEAGALRTEEKSQPSVIQTVTTLNGPVQIVWPLEHVDQIIDSLKKAKEEAEKKPIPTNSDLYIPDSALEVEQVKAAHDKVSEGKS